MGRAKRQSGAHAIRHAEQLFRQSVERGSPDYTHVARAIGYAPHAPPSWAVWACIELRQNEEPTAARGHAAKLGEILDDIVRFFDREQQKHLFEMSGQYSSLETYTPPSLRSAILQVLKERSHRQENFGSASDDWFRDIREAWDWEQEHDIVPSSLWQLEEGAVTYSGKKLKTTSRIERVMMQTVAAEEGDPQDVQVWAWITKRIIEDEE